MTTYTRTLAASLLLLSLACSGTNADPDEEFSGLYDGTTTSGWSVSSESEVEVRTTKDDGDDVLDVVGQEASGTTISFEIPPGAADGSIGITFEIRGNADIRFSATTTGVKPVENGGTCIPTELPCWDIHGADLSVSTEWRTITLTWDQLQQTGSGVFVPFDAATITHLNFAPAGTGVFNIRIDDIAFITSVDGDLTPVEGTGGTVDGGSGGTAGDGDGDVTGSGGAMTTGGTSSGGSGSTTDHRLGKYLTSSMFLNQFSFRNPSYKYSQLLAAVDLFEGFASCCSETQKKREIAAFMAHVEHETDHLAATEEYAPRPEYCQTGMYPCAAGKSYHGRGALQLTWNYNYSFAQDYFASQGKVYSPSLVDQPEQVASDEELLWSTALWFWMVGDPTFVNDTMHDRINSEGFGSTIRKINGALECDGAGPQQVQQRIDYYTKWCDLLGVDPGSNLSC